ncbi:MAG: hypothetical protein RJB10_1984, partial [Pseudomonadota bacterium]
MLLTRLLFLLSVVCYLMPALSQTKQSFTLTPKQISPSVWYVEGVTALGSVENKNFISNAAFIVGPDGIVV